MADVQNLYTDDGRLSIFLFFLVPRVFQRFSNKPFAIILLVDVGSSQVIKSIRLMSGPARSFRYAVSGTLLIQVYGSFVSQFG